MLVLGTIILYFNNYYKERIEFGGTQVYRHVSTWARVFMGSTQSAGVECSVEELFFLVGCALSKC